MPLLTWADVCNDPVQLGERFCRDWSSGEVRKPYLRGQGQSEQSTSTLLHPMMAAYLSILPDNVLFGLPLP